jgi:hypothetical protein
MNFSVRLTGTALLIIFSTGVALNASAAPVTGQATEFTSSNGLKEQCVQIDDFPGAHYSHHDRGTEKTYCSMDLGKMVMCPKLWSTSPGTILYQLEAGQDVLAFERQHCGDGHHVGDLALDKPAVFKMSVNGSDTSGTYAPSSWVYYHFSRYFRTNVHVPVAVYRSLDREVHHERVTRPALGLVEGKRHMKMLAAGWKFVETVETGAGGGVAAAEMLTDDGRQVFGVLVDNKGDRYGPEFNGTRESGWGNGQNHDSQQTAPFLALRTGGAISEAARAAIREARKNPKMARALAADTPVEQIVFWMQDAIEITLMDYIFGQQDRIGNIDWRWYWYWIEDGKLKSDHARGSDVPDELAGQQVWRIKQSASNDNDAGVRRGYANFTKRTHMLEDLNHYSPHLYQRLGRLAMDFKAQGPAYQWMRQSAGLSERTAGDIAARAVEAFELLQGQCRAGSMKLDLDLVAFLQAKEVGNASCEIDPS